jgi:hypothetical protein
MISDAQFKSELQILQMLSEIYDGDHSSMYPIQPGTAKLVDERRTAGVEFAITIFLYNMERALHGAQSR